MWMQSYLVVLLLQQPRYIVILQRQASYQLPVLLLQSLQNAFLVGASLSLIWLWSASLPLCFRIDLVYDQADLQELRPVQSVYRPCTFRSGSS